MEAALAAPLRAESLAVTCYSIGHPAIVRSRKMAAEASWGAQNAHLPDAPAIVRSLRQRSRESSHDEDRTTAHRGRCAGLPQNLRYLALRRRRLGFPALDSVLAADPAKCSRVRSVAPRARQPRSTSGSSPLGW